MKKLKATYRKIKIGTDKKGQFFRWKMVSPRFYFKENNIVSRRTAKEKCMRWVDRNTTGSYGSYTP